MLLLYTYLKLYTFLPRVCNVETDKVCERQCVFVHEPVMKRRGVRGGEKERDFGSAEPH